MLPAPAPISDETVKIVFGFGPIEAICLLTGRRVSKQSLRVRESRYPPAGSQYGPAVEGSTTQVERGG
jgi:hypothetical protein